jgi:hypothetical protein
MLAIFLNKLEEHRTLSLFEASLTTKIFIFQFINNYFTLFYIAFFKSGAINGGVLPWGFSDMCVESGGGTGAPGDSCETDLFQQMIALMITRSLMANLQDYVLPLLLKRLAAEQEDRRHAQRLLAAEPGLSAEALAGRVAGLKASSKAADVQYALPVGFLYFICVSMHERKVWSAHLEKRRRAGLTHTFLSR